MKKRKSDDGTVRLRKDGRWEGRVVIGYDDRGYPKTKNVLAKTKKECLEKLKALKEQCTHAKLEHLQRCPRFYCLIYAQFCFFAFLLSRRNAVTNPAKTVPHP